MLLIFLVGTIGMAIPFSLVLGSLRRIDATRVGIVSMLELVAAGIIAYFWLGQHLDAWQLTGFPSRFSISPRPEPLAAAMY